MTEKKTSKELADPRGFEKLTVEEQVANIDWLRREITQFEEGQSKVIPSEYFNDVSREMNISLSWITGWPYFVRLHTKDPKLIEYIHNYDHGRIGKVTVCKIGKFFAALVPIVGKKSSKLAEFKDEDIAKLSIIFKNYSTPPKLEITQDPKKVIKVYEKGPRSCMSDKKERFEKASEIKNFKLPVHPAHIYGTPDCGIAFVKRGMKYTARAAVNLIDKKYSTIYGDSHTLEKMLKDAGFKRGNLLGCRINRVDLDQCGPVITYLDNNPWVREDEKEPDKYLVVCREKEAKAKDVTSFYCQNTWGLTVRPMKCDKCGEWFDREKRKRIEGVGSICPKCQKKHEIILDSYSGERILKENALLITGEYEQPYYVSNKRKTFEYKGLVFLQPRAEMYGLALDKGGNVIETPEVKYNEKTNRFRLITNAARERYWNWVEDNQKKFVAS